MEVTGMQIGFDALLSLISGIVGALTVWYTLKSDATASELKSEMNAMELRIIQAIHDIKK